ncbi:MAG: MarR family transcriptional regulator [Candidatus Izimaplasma sp.]|nr:MarR family transcriptional regulator [Candidatus Izimaplasma bacterium]
MIKEMCYKMNKSNMLYKRIMAKHLEDMNITYAQLLVLRVIKAEPGITAKEILLQMDTDKATLSGIISRLERDGYIYRERNEQDKRVRNIYISEASKDICNQVKQIESKCLSTMIDGIDDADMNQFLEVIDLLIENQIKELGEQTDE